MKQNSDYKPKDELVVATRNFITQVAKFYQTQDQRTTVEIAKQLLEEPDDFYKNLYKENSDI